MGGGLLGISEKIYFHFQNLTKKCNKVWTISKAETTLLFSSVLHFFCFWKYTESSIFLEKLIGQWIPDRDGRGIARDIKKIVFIFKTRQKMAFWKWKYFFLISLAIPRPLRSGIHWPIIFFKKKLTILDIFNKKIKTEEKRRVISAF